MLQSLCQGEFMSKNPTVAWEFLEDLAKKTMQWEITIDDSLSSRIASARDMDSVLDLSHIEFRLIALENWLKGLTI